MKKLEGFELDLVSGGVEPITATAGNGSDAQRQRERARQAEGERARSEQAARDRGEIRMDVRRDSEGGVSVGVTGVFRF